MYASQQETAKDLNILISSEKRNEDRTEGRCRLRVWLFWNNGSEAGYDVIS
jgi:hypothetical protein